jgi:hypothetical protein
MVGFSYWSVCIIVILYLRYYTTIINNYTLYNLYNRQTHPRIAQTVQFLPHPRTAQTVRFLPHPRIAQTVRFKQSGALVFGVQLCSWGRLRTIFGLSLANFTSRAMRNRAIASARRVMTH